MKKISAKKSILNASIIFFAIALLTFATSIFISSENLKTKSEIKGVSKNATRVIKIGNFEFSSSGIESTSIDAFKFIKAVDLKLDTIAKSYYGDRDFDEDINYYKLGNILNGKYKGYEIIYAFDDSSSPFNIFKPVVFLQKGNQIVLMNFKNQNGSLKELVPKTHIQDNVEILKDTSMYDYFDRSEIATNSMPILYSQLTSIYEPSNFSKFNEKINGVDVYLSSKESGVFTISLDGFYKKHVFKPNFYIDEIPQVKWSTASAGNNIYKYDYRFKAGCRGDKVDEVEINADDLIKTGKTSTGEDAYEYIDPKKDEFLQKIYNEDYKNLYKKNTIQEDDTKILNMNEFLKHHPVFYSKNHFGKYVRNVSKEFALVTNCTI